MHDSLSHLAPSSFSFHILMTQSSSKKEKKRKKGLKVSLLIHSPSLPSSSSLKATGFNGRPPAIRKGKTFFPTVLYSYSAVSWGKRREERCYLKKLSSTQ